MNLRTLALAALTLSIIIPMSGCCTLREVFGCDEYERRMAAKSVEAPRPAALAKPAVETALTTPVKDPVIASTPVVETPRPVSASPAKTAVPELSSEFDRAGFATTVRDGRLWAFRKGSKELEAFQGGGESAKHVTRIGAGPNGMTLKAPDTETLDEYLASKPGYLVKIDDGRLWVFRKGSKELEAFQRGGELAKHVTRIGAGPNGMTLKGPDTETLDGYLATN